MSGRYTLSSSFRMRFRVEQTWLSEPSSSARLGSARNSTSTSRASDRRAEHEPQIICSYEHEHEHERTIPSTSSSNEPIIKRVPVASVCQSHRSLSHVGLSVPSALGCIGSSVESVTRSLGPHCSAQNTVFVNFSAIWALQDRIT